MTDLQEGADVDQRDGDPEDQAPLAGTGSMLERLRAQREAIGLDLDTVLDVPGHDGLLCVRYRLPHFRRVKEIVEQSQRESGGESDLNFASDILAETCMEVLVRDPESDRTMPIDEAHGVTRFDAHLADLFQIQLPPRATGRQIVRLVFNRDFAVSQTAGRLIEWMGEANKRSNELYSGE